MRQRVLCPYCEGGGVITCGQCCGCGTTVLATVSGAADKCVCETCGGIGVRSGLFVCVLVNFDYPHMAWEVGSGVCCRRVGYDRAQSFSGITMTIYILNRQVVACVNCRGEGVTVPVVLQRKQLDIPVRNFIGSIWSAVFWEAGLAKSFLGLFRWSLKPTFCCSRPCFIFSLL